MHDSILILVQQAQQWQSLQLGFIRLDDASRFHIFGVTCVHKVVHVIVPEHKAIVVTYAAIFAQAGKGEPFLRLLSGAGLANFVDFTGLIDLGQRLDGVVVDSRPPLVLDQVELFAGEKLEIHIFLCHAQHAAIEVTKAGDEGDILDFVVGQVLYHIRLAIEPELVGLLNLFQIVF